MKARVKNYLSVTKKEWNGMVVLVIIILLVLVAPYVYQLFRKDSTINPAEFNKAVALIEQGKHGGDNTFSDKKNANSPLFIFDPNDVTDEQWKQLGLSDHQVTTIKNYLSKGGHFYKNEDLKKIYGITDADYKRLDPYIRIGGGEYVSDKVAVGVITDINSADSAKLTRIRGIGPTFAQRIIEYRTRLGGFLNKDQLKEVYGVDTVRFAQLKNEISVDASNITKIRINEVDFEGLRKFPYLTNKQTNAIIQYRKQHGDYHSIADMKNVVILDEDILRKIEPYISFK